MKFCLVILVALFTFSSTFAMTMVNDEPKYTTQEYIQSFCILEYCPQHINDKEFKNQKLIPAKACYEDCCKDYGGCPKEPEH